MYKYTVVGKGMLGSAAAKYLSGSNSDVAIIGPDEPADFKTHTGVFASHYDSGRITRILDSEYIWALAAKRSIEMYPVIEEKSGIKFFQAKGCVKVVPDTPERRAYIDKNEETGNRLNALSERLDASALKANWPFLSFPSGSIAISERDTAGWINPRKLVEAQLIMAKQNDAAIINDTVVKITRTSGIFELQTISGAQYTSEKVLIAAGGYSNFHELLPRKLDLIPRAETIVQAQLDDAQVEQYLSMPSVIWFLNDRPDLKYVYIVPPAQYPDGKYYIKMGGDREAAHHFSNIEELTEWFHCDGGQDAITAYKVLIQEMLPDLKVEQWLSKPCVITDTTTERPYIDAVEEGLFVAAGGCGAAAKSSDEFGRLAAICAQGQTEPSYGEHAFKAVFKGENTSDITKRQFLF